MSWEELIAGSFICQSQKAIAEVVGLRHKINGKKNVNAFTKHVWCIHNISQIKCCAYIHIIIKKYTCKTRKISRSFQIGSVWGVFSPVGLGWPCPHPSLCDSCWSLACLGEARRVAYGAGRALDQRAKHARVRESHWQKGIYFKCWGLKEPLGLSYLKLIFCRSVSTISI